MKNQANYYNNNLLILDVKQFKKIMKLYYFHTLKTLWDGQGKIKVYYGMSKVKTQLSRKRSIVYVYLILRFFQFNKHGKRFDMF